MESQREIRKIDKFQNLVEDYLSFAEKVLAARKDTLHNLKYSNVFYNAQLEDAKKVAQVSELLNIFCLTFHYDLFVRYISVTELITLFSV